MNAPLRRLRNLAWLGALAWGSAIANPVSVPAPPVVAADAPAAGSASASAGAGASASAAAKARAGSGAASPARAGASAGAAAKALASASAATAAKTVPGASGASAAKTLAAAAAAKAEVNTKPAVAAVAAASAPALVVAASAIVPDKPCEVLVRRMPNLSNALCEAALLVPSGAHSVRGFPLYQRDLSERAFEVLPPEATLKPQRRPRVLVVGGIHGDELSSTSLVFHWIARAIETGAEMDWRFIPALNPDGLMEPRPTRTNARGVDLNRNFPTPGWAREAPEYWSQRTKSDPRRYPGPAPLSEPESRFVQETMDRWKPDLIVSVHAPYGVLDYDGPSIPPDRLGRLFLDRVGIFPGSLGHYGGVHRGVPVVTIELPSAIRTPTNAEMRQMWIDLLRWIGERLMQYQQNGR